MFFGDIPEEYAGWMYTQINANSTWMPGPIIQSKKLSKVEFYSYLIMR